MGRIRFAVDPARVIHLRKQGLTMREIASRLGIADSTVNTVLQKAKKEGTYVPPSSPAKKR